MKNEYWDQFVHTGQIEAYLDYRENLTASTEEDEKRGETDAGRPDIRDRDGNWSYSHWGLR